MVLLWEIFVPVGRLLGRLMADHPNTITAYSVNVAGSLVGIWLFVLTSALYLPPVAWFGVFAVLAACVRRHGRASAANAMHFCWSESPGLAVVVAASSLATRRCAGPLPETGDHGIQPDGGESPDWLHRLLGERSIIHMASRSHLHQR